MNLRKFFADYGLLALIAVILLAVLPQFILPYLDIFGTSSYYVASFGIMLVAIWLAKRAKPMID